MKKQPNSLDTIIQSGYYLGQQCRSYSTVRSAMLFRNLDSLWRRAACILVAAPKPQSQSTSMIKSNFALPLEKMCEPIQMVHLSATPAHRRHRRAIQLRPRLKPYRLDRRVLRILRSHSERRRARRLVQRAINRPRGGEPRPVHGIRLASSDREEPQKLPIGHFLGHIQNQLAIFLISLAQ